MTKNSIGYALLSALIAGSLDICLAFLTAFIKSGAGADRVLRYVASGLLGKSAFTGSDWIVLLGLLIHYMIAMVFGFIFFLFYPKLQRWIKNKILIGICYGIFVWIVMNLLILPLSRVPKLVYTIENLFIGISVLIIALGWPLTYLAAKFYSKNKVAQHDQ
jgi:uncharacterized membrane protein YagU involved in acid resistance